MKSLLLGLIFGAVMWSSTIPIFSTGQGLSGGQTDTHWTYSVVNNSGATVTGNAIVLSSPTHYFEPGFTGDSGNWPFSSGDAVWISTCDLDNTLNCLTGSFSLPVNVTYTTTFNLAGLDPNSASLSVQSVARRSAPLSTD